MSGGDYEIGYRKPPVHTQFKKGEKRPRRRKKAAGVDICGFFDEKVSVSVDGSKRQIHSFEIAVTNLAKNAIEGNMRAASRFIDLCESAGLFTGEATGSLWPSILRIPIDHDDDEWTANLNRFGPPPWPLEHDGKPRIEEYRDGRR